MKNYSFLQENATSYGMSTIIGSQVGWLLANRYTDILTSIILNSDTPKQAIQSILSNKEIESNSIKETYCEYIYNISNDPDWKSYVLKKIERRKIYGIIVGAVGGASLRYGVGKLFGENDK